MIFVNALFLALSSLLPAPVADLSEAAFQASEGNCRADVAPGENECDTPALEFPAVAQDLHCFLAYSPHLTSFQFLTWPCDPNPSLISGLLDSGLGPSFPCQGATWPSVLAVPQRGPLSWF